MRQDIIDSERRRLARKACKARKAQEDQAPRSLESGDDDST